MEQGEKLQIDQNQCQRLKGYYGFETFVIITLPGNGGETMTAPVPEYSTHIYQMMARLGIDPGAGVLPQLSLRYATALRRCENCRSKKDCQDWLDYAPAMINFAPDFCMNADILFELQYDQPWSRRIN
jgi:uncharacterized protein DUF6455